ENFRASPTKIIADAILHALTTPYPKNTYYIGLDAKVLASVNWLLGDRVAETVQFKVLFFVSN
ncbi:10624_t:CDS:1, partial [Dentiscutata erythropus]